MAATATKNRTSLLIVGLVRGGAWARDVVKTDDLSLVGIVDIDTERLQRTGDEQGVPPERRFADINKALDLDADTVVIATPTPTHAELSLAALRAGHTVICEKPLARSLEEARQLREQVKQTGQRFMVGENYRYSDGMENLYSMRATLQDGTHVHYLTSRALSRPQTTWPGNLVIVGEEGTLAWDGSGAAVTLIRELPTHNYRDQHLATGPVTYVSHEAAASVVGGSGSAISSTMQMVRSLVDAMREGRPHPNDIEDNWVSFATAMAAVESAQTGRAVRVARA